MRNSPENSGSLADYLTAPENLPEELIYEDNLDINMQDNSTEIDFLDVRDEFELSKASLKVKKNAFFVKFEKKF